MRILPVVVAASTIVGASFLAPNSAEATPVSSNITVVDQTSAVEYAGYYYGYHYRHYHYRHYRYHHYYYRPVYRRHYYRPYYYHHYYHPYRYGY